MKVSVVVPVYNVEKYLPRCLDGLCRQTLRDIEIICVDDGSTDASSAMLDAAAERDGRIRVVHQRNAGAGQARNVGLDLARGEYLFFCDTDDWCESRMLEEMYAYASRQDVDVLFVSHYVCEGDDDTVVERRAMPPRLASMKRPFSPSDVARNVFQIFSHVPWNKLFRTDFIRGLKLRFQSLPRSNDAFFVEAALAAANRVAVLDRAYYYHRVRRPGSVVDGSDRHPMTGYAARDALREFLKARGVFDVFGGSWAKAVFLSAIADIPGLSSVESVERSYGEIRSRLVADPDMSVLREDSVLNDSRREIYETIVGNEDVRPFLLALLRARKRAIGELQRQRWRLLGARPRWVKSALARIGWIDRV